jgi:hypothetical protein
MKAQTIAKLCVWSVVSIFIASCKGKTGSASSSGSTATSGSAASTASISNSVVDSLKITDPDEKKVCALYDECVTVYLDEMKALAADTGKLNSAQRTDIEKKYQDKVKALQPDIDRLQKSFQVNPMEAIKFASFSAYESRRIVAIVAVYEKSILKNYGVTK